MKKSYIQAAKILDDLPAIAFNVDQYQHFLSASDYKQALLTLIASATKRIYIVALYLQNDEGGQQILDALYRAKVAKPELEITILVDYSRAKRGLIGQHNEQIETNAQCYLRNQQIHNHSITILGVPINRRELFGVLHLKGSVFDDKVLYSGASINNIYLAQKETYRYDRYQLVSHALLADSMVHFIEQWLVKNPAVTSFDETPPVRQHANEIRKFRAQLKEANYHFEADVCSKEQLSITPLVGFGTRDNELNHIICQMLASAQQEIFICTPYFNFPLKVLTQLKRALKRGVKITIIVGDKTANDFYVSPDQPFHIIHAIPYLYEMNLRHFARQYEQMMANRQLNIYLWQDHGNSFHLKGITVDQRYLLLTGSNINPRAWKLDLENGLLIRDHQHQLNELMQEERTQIMSHCQLVGSFQNLDEVSHYPFGIKRFLIRLKRVKLTALFNQVL